MKIQRNVAIVLFVGALLLLFYERQSSQNSPAHSFSEPSKSPSAKEDAGFATSRIEQTDDIDNSRRSAITRAVEMVSPAVVGISVKSIQEYQFNSIWDMLNYWGPLHREVKGLGSGFIISEDGFIVTSDHIVGDAQEIKVTLTDGETYDARLVESEFTSDIGLLKIEGSGFPTAKLGDSGSIIIGEWVIALGNPFGLFEINDQPSVTVGVVSAVDRDFGWELAEKRIYQDMIQTDASINPGNSGGPLVNSDGEVIGVNSFILTGGSGSQGSIGIGFAIPINKVKRVVEELKERAASDKTYWIGFSGYTLDSSEAHRLGISVNEGVLVSGVERLSPAERANLRIGDVITAVSGNKVRTVNDIREYIAETDPQPGTKIALSVIRNDRLYETTLTLERRRRRRN